MIYQLVIDWIDELQDRYVTLYLLNENSLQDATMTATSILNYLPQYTTVNPILASLLVNVDYDRPLRNPIGSVKNRLLLVSETNTDPLHNKRFSFTITLPMPVAGLFQVDEYKVERDSPTFLSFQQQILSKLCDIRGNQFSKLIDGHRVIS